MTTNLAAFIRGLTPPPALLIGEVLAVGSDNMSTVQFPDGSQQRVRGTSVGVGEPAFVRDGVIDGRAPAYVATTIEV
jgi:hypothetical protein